MRDADDAAILRQVIFVLATAIFCLVCGAAAGLIVVRDSIGAGPGEQRVQMPPETRPR